ncbi:hypothetical protein DFH07DRAFT_782175 [Mycena maculata]|uniref:Protein kinase domain-containing protein n=1 Tax=Mycena maculata TaxID=230809 RepID=A0AAD7MSA6_9AGAR|nr:hypothetical protein DFH07DRAFT_782175 [Mycena maculata]
MYEEIGELVATKLQTLDYLQQHPIAHRNLHSDNLLLNSQAVLNLNFSNIVLVNPETPLSTDPVAIIYWQAPLPEYLMEVCPPEYEFLPQTESPPLPPFDKDQDTTSTVSQWPSDRDIVGLDPLNRLEIGELGGPSHRTPGSLPVYEDGAQRRGGKLLERKKWVDRICTAPSFDSGQRVKQRKPQHRLRATLEFAASRQGAVELAVPRAAAIPGRGRSGSWRAQREGRSSGWVLAGARGTWCAVWNCKMSGIATGAEGRGRTQQRRGSTSARGGGGDGVGVGTEFRYSGLSTTDMTGGALRRR